MRRSTRFASRGDVGELPGDPPRGRGRLLRPARPAGDGGSADVPEDVEAALDAGVATKTHVLNILHRLIDGKAAAPEVIAPQALKLSTEPQANVLRYDLLRAAQQDKEVRHGT